MSKGGDFEVGLEALRRQFKNVKMSPLSELSLLMQEGSFHKRDFKFSCVLDTRDNSTSPTHGHLTRLSNELAFDLQRFKFWKSTLELNWVTEFLQGQLHHCKQYLQVRLHLEFEPDGHLYTFHR